MAANSLGDKERPKPIVSVIVPARNEEVCLGECLTSLLYQHGIDFEIIVVDDHSTDKTRQIAESYVGVQVIQADPLPTGWTGKNNAAHCGAKVAKGDWLLFTDADTVHRRGSLRHAVREAEEHDADLLSYSPKQDVVTFWERALMPVVFAELRNQYPPEKVRDPMSPIVAANGQYLLISREAYNAVGGHAGVADRLLEDVELARKVKEAGAIVRFRYGRDAVKTRMYRSRRQMFEGWTKNLALLFPATLKLALLRAGEFLVFLTGVGVTVFSFYRYSLHLFLIGLAIGVPSALNFFLRIRRAHFGWINSILATAGLPMFVLLLLRSRNQYMQNDVVWKGRHYAPVPRAKTPPREEPVTAK